MISNNNAMHHNKTILTNSEICAILKKRGKYENTNER